MSRYLAALTATAAILVIGIGIWLFHHSYSGWETIYASGEGNKIILLPDSTEVTLAPNAELRFNRKHYAHQMRLIELRGKAFFNVIPDRNSPFKVDAGKTNITVLGTSFQVDEKKEEVSIAVLTGKVRFNVPHREDAVLTAGMSAYYSAKQKTIEIRSDNNPNDLAWKTGILIFRDTPLAEVIHTLESYYRVTIQPEKQPDYDLRLTATFDNMTFEQVIRIINKTLGVSL